MVLTEEEQRLQKEPFEVSWVTEDGKQQKANKVVVELTGTRREGKGKELEYEVKYRDGSEGYLSLKTLTRRGWDKGCKAIDARIAQRAGLYIRTLSSANVESHLAGCGLEAEFATHYRMSALSGGQKVKGYCFLPQNSFLVATYSLTTYSSFVVYFCQWLWLPPCGTNHTF